MVNEYPEKHTLPWLPVLVFLVFSVALAGTGLLVYQNQREAFLHDLDTDLSVIAGFKVRLISSWRKEQESDGAAIAGNQLVGRQVKTFLEEGVASPLSAPVRDWLAALAASRNFRDVLLVDAGDHVVLSTSPAAASMGEGARRLLAEARRAGRPCLSDLHTAPGVVDDVHLDLAVPLYDQPGSRESVTPVAALLIRIDPKSYLYPLVESWPTTYKTAETLLVRRDGDEVVFLHELRHQKHTALTLKFPVTTPELPAAMVVRGARGIVMGRDYRGRPVVAVLSAVPDSPWFMVAKVDEAEVFLPLRAVALRVMLTAGLLILLAAGALSLAWQRQAARFYRARYQAVHERQEAERKLRESEAKYRDLVQNVNSAILRLDAAGRVLFINPFAERFFGYSKTDIIGRNVVGTLAADGTPGARAMAAMLAADAAASDTQATMEIEHRCKAGERAWMVWTWQRLRDDEGQVTEVLCVGVDVTARNEVENALLAERQLLRTLVDNMPDMIYFKDTQHRFVMVNSGCLRILGAASMEAAIGKTDFDFFPANLAEQYWTDEEQLLQSGTPLLNKEEALADTAGRRRWVLTTKVPLRDAAGKLSGLVGIGRDITDHKRLEQQFVQSQKMEVIGQLAGGVAHDFNNLLQAILGFADILLTDMAAEDPRRADVLEITRAAERASSLTQKLLAFSRKQVMEPRVVDLNALVEVTQKMLRRLIGEEIALETVLEPGLPRVKVDPTQIDQILMNLTVNARDAMPSGGRIVIKTWHVELDPAAAAVMPEGRPGRFVCLSVTDAGVGMTREIMDRLFEPFFSTKGAGKGTGLGLAVVYGVARQHEGWVTVQSRVGHGSVFTLYLPSCASGEADQPASSAPPALHVQGRGERILLVEDDESARGLAVRVLDQHGYRVTVAVDAEEAGELFTQQNGQFDLVFTDVVLPDLNGVELVEQLRARNPRLKVLMASGYMDDKARQPLIREKQIRFLQKPYLPAGLLQAVAEVLQEPATG